MKTYMYHLQRRKLTMLSSYPFLSFPTNYQYLQFSHSVMSDSATPWIIACQASLHHQLPEFTQTLFHQIDDAIQPSHALSSPSPPAPNPSQHQGLFQWVNSASDGQSIRVSALASVLPMNTQNWSPLGWMSWTSLQSKELSRVFSNTTVQKHRFFGAQLSSQSNSHIHTWPMEKPQPWLDGPLLAK